MSAHKHELGQHPNRIEGRSKPRENITIQRLTPDLAEKYVHFFDVTPHDINRDEMKCYCITWRSDDSYAGAGHWFDTREERRAASRTSFAFSLPKCPLEAEESKAVRCFRLAEAT